MKKFFALAAIAFAAFAVASCEKPANNGDNGDDPISVKKVLKSLASKVDENGEMLSGRTFTFDEQGRITEVSEIWSGGGEVHTATWEGNTVTFVKDGENKWSWTLGENGYVTSCVKGSSTYTYEYDTEGHLIKINEDWGEGLTLVSVVTWENGNMTSWTKHGETNEDENNPGTEIPQVKRQTYKTELNVGGIFTAYPEKGNLSQWMLELGYFGKASKNLVATDKWDHKIASYIATFEYRTDDDDFVVAQMKYLPDSDTGVIGLDDSKYYIWEVVE